ncbi:hypothetical protein [Streptomyces rubiginosohelvolus]|nr:hypothetical protein OG475_14160 [Streptomyces rubiginosohelvolus]
MDPNLEKPRKQWTGAEKAQVWVSVAALLVAIIALVGQFAR